MPLLEAGTYEGLEIIGSVLQPGKGDDDPVIVISFMDLQTQESINAYLYTTEKAWPYTRKKLEACGFDLAAFDGDLSVLNDSPSPIQGKKVRVVVEESEYQGKKVLKVTQIGDDLNFSERMEPDQAKAFAAKLRARLVTSGELKSGNARQKKATPAQTKRTDEDSVPF